ncbi:hypothetical protein AAFC00_006787 [Neodothiora populina]|uniref:Uncharacterized protein n=1 Tax=Neodothiora populina TaxID=2781224 RepID=A0ABR3PBK2_9PEZI
MTSFYTSSPTVIIPPRPVPDQHYSAGHYRAFQPPLPANGLFNQLSGNSTTSIPPTPSAGCLAGRKRSRGDTDDDLDDNAIAAPIAQPSVPKGEPTYGPGMTLIYPSDSRGHYASEPAVEEAAVEAAATNERPIMRNRKSQRTTARASDESAALPLPEQSLASEPLIDQATRLLGISWMRLDRYEGGRINQRAYTRWIECHYPSLVKAELWFENSSIPGYLGTAFNKATGAQQYLLWSFDLKQAVLVTRQPSELIPLLSTTPPANLIKAATVSIFANDQPTFEDGNTPPPEAPASIPQAGAMDVDA